MAPILAECSETYVQRFFQLAAAAAVVDGSVRLDYWRLAGVSGRLDYCNKVTGNIDVLTLTIQNLQTHIHRYREIQRKTERHQIGTIVYIGKMCKLRFLAEHTNGSAYASVVSISSDIRHAVC